MIAFDTYIPSETIYNTQFYSEDEMLDCKSNDRFTTYLSFRNCSNLENRIEYSNFIKAEYFNKYNSFFNIDVGKSLSKGCAVFGQEVLTFNMDTILNDIYEKEIFVLEISKQMDNMLCSYSNIDKALLFIFENMQDILLQRKYDICDLFLRKVDLQKYNTYVLLGILTATYPWRKKLFFRNSFYYNIKKKISLSYSPEEVEQILGGLD